MTCYYPLQGWRSAKPHPVTGRRSLVFKIKEALTDMPVEVPCGQCIGCKLERSRQWAMRCYHEASLYERNCFITLTYDEAHLPADSSVDVREFQLFMKRLRKKYGPAIRFFHCGEYGEDFGRPHYHACLFNHDFDDKKLWRRINDVPLYTSESLEALWGKGFCSVGDVTFESAAYVARYIVKKITGDKAEAHYQGRRPEYTTMSRRPGIGQGWYEKFSAEIWPDDFVVLRGRKMRPPKYYDKLMEAAHEKEFRRIKGSRSRSAKLHAADNTSSRHRVREKVQLARLKKLPRNLG